MKEKLQQYLTTKWPAIIWSVIVFLLLVMPPVSLNKEKQIEVSGLDKVTHFFLFGLLVYLWGYYLKTTSTERQKLKRNLVIITIASSFYGIAMEYVQDWVGRDFDVWDMVADTAGAVAAFIVLVLEKRKPR
ncbi:MAG: VanZ family protein [Chitinophagaceae bacterium]|nr:VanZ family protein [Chitinophagaceae bacterium]